jgi:hypothetical protein
MKPGWTNRVNAGTPVCEVRDPKPEGLTVAGPSTCIRRFEIGDLSRYVASRKSRIILLAMLVSRVRIAERLVP